MNCELTTLCYLQRDGKYLMLHRTVKKNDVNHDRWIGVGGHFEQDESPEECLVREVKEETGYTLTGWRFRGVVTFVSGNGVTELMCLYISDAFCGEPVPCDEGVLEWVDIDRIWTLNLWPGDKIFFRLLDEDLPFFSLKLVYDGSGGLVRAALDGRSLELFDLVDEQTGDRTGLVQERGVVHREGDPHATVHIWVVRPQAAPREQGCGWDVLLQLRARDKDSHPGCYDTSSAGHIAAGGTVTASAQRELQEELGMVRTENELVYLGRHFRASEGSFHGRLFRDREWANVFVCTRPPAAGELTLQREEVQDVLWMDLAECRKKIGDGSLRNCISAEELDMLTDYLRRGAEGVRNDNGTF
ncbi:MAG: NUDIX domain-containing protein [Lachnospiraceae bacterium]|jgi:8-oxo-dGTP pyrophosphatase MutT (NUDIX family)|nr:NUDIX domain-containing protein [Lachnospiraceae bacterium]